MKKLFLLFWAVFLSMGIFAQNQEIKGKVIDAANGEALPGVSIVVKGTTIGTTTNFDGDFNLSVEKGKTIVFSFVGYINKEIQVSDSENVEVLLEPDVLNLEQVVVVGYGIQKKKDKTGAVMSVGAEDLQQGVLQDPIQGIMGKVAGVNITKRGGDPNAGFTVQIRGTAGFFSGTSPLYVVDGVPGVDPTTISAEDIESFNVLKDASSAAIYGSRGATGVIIITTKKGKFNQKGKISYSGYISTDKVANDLDLLSANDIRKYASDNALTLDDRGANTDWQDETFRTGNTQSHNIAMSGGGDDHNYRASIGYDNFEGVLRGTSRERAIMRLNATQKGINDRLTLNLSLSGTFENNNYVQTNGNNSEAVLFQTFSRNPTYPVYNEDGSFFEVNDFENSNPVALIDQLTNERDAKRYLANAKADFEIADGLIAGANVSYRKDDDETLFFRPSYQISSSDGGYGRRGYNNSETKMIETTIKYNKVFKEKHNVNLLGGYSWQEDKSTSLAAQGRDFLSDEVGANNLRFANDVLPQDIESWKERSRLISFIGRAVYNFDSKYYLTATIRRDGSSRFGDNNEWGWFPSFSTAWNVSSESFLDNTDWLDQLKFRVGFGVTGNQEIGNYHDIARISTGGRTLDPTTGEETLVIQQSSNANPDLKWEENREWNFGLDFAILNNKLTGSIDYYNKTTDDLLAEYAVPVPPNRFESIYANAGEISNKGLEINLTANPIRSDNFTWKSTYSFSVNKQEVVSLSDGNYSLDNMHASWISGRGMVGVWTQLIEPGRELGTFYGWKHAGIDQNGQWLFYDKDGNITKDQRDEDRQVIGQALPDFTMSWTNQFTYKNWDLGFSLRAVVGGDVLNVTRMILGNPSMLPNRNALKDALTLAPILTDAPKFSDYYIENGSFLRLDNITLGYNLNVDKISWLSKCRFYISSNNLFTLTNYSGIDPESSYGGYENLGLDMYDVYPKTKTLTFGMKVGF